MGPPHGEGGTGDAGLRPALSPPPGLRMSCAAPATPHGPAGRRLAFRQRGLRSRDVCLPVPLCLQRSARAAGRGLGASAVSLRGRADGGKQRELCVWITAAPGWRSLRTGCPPLRALGPLCQGRGEERGRCAAVPAAPLAPPSRRLTRAGVRRLFPRPEEPQPPLPRAPCSPPARRPRKRHLCGPFSAPGPVSGSGSGRALTCFFPVPARLSPHQLWSSPSMSEAASGA